MKWLLRGFAVLSASALILFGIEKYLFSFERGQLFAWWFMQGKGWQAEQSVAQRVEGENTAPFVKEIVKLLASSSPNSVSQKVALSFAEEFKSEPDVAQQLIIIAHDHPDIWVRCEWKKSMESGGNVTIITTHEGKQTRSAFALIADECKQ